MPAPVCVTCQVEFRVKRNDIAAELMAAERSYQVWSADLWECPSCHFQIVSGFGACPIFEHFQAGYIYSLERQSVNGHARYWGNLEDQRRGLAAIEVVNAS